MTTSKGAVARIPPLRERIKMEKEGLVQADRSQSNNTTWKLLEGRHETQ